MILAYTQANDNYDREAERVKEFTEYPENRLDIRVDEQGNTSYQINPVFAGYYMMTREEKEEELEELMDRLELLETDEPDDIYSEEYEDWEEEKERLEEEIRELETDIDEMT